MKKHWGDDKQKLNTVWLHVFLRAWMCNGNNWIKLFAISCCQLNVSTSSMASESKNEVNESKQTARALINTNIGPWNRFRFNSSVVLFFFSVCECFGDSLFLSLTMFVYVEHVSSKWARNHFELSIKCIAKKQHHQLIISV